LVTVASGERGVKRACDVGRVAAFHPSVPLFTPIISGVFSLTGLSAKPRTRRFGKYP
jgi:hypothetical protein